MTMEQPAAIALLRKSSSDDSDDGLRPKTPVRKGKKKPPAQAYARTNLATLKGDALRLPSSPQPEGQRHSDRAPEQRVKALREERKRKKKRAGGDLRQNASADEASPRRRPTREKRQKERKTRSLSPPTEGRKAASAKKIVAWKPNEFLKQGEASPKATAESNNPQESEPSDVESLERSLGSLIDEIEAHFGGIQETSVYHQSTTSLPAVPVYSSADEDDVHDVRASPAIDMLLSMAVASTASAGVQSGMDDRAPGEAEGESAGDPSSQQQQQQQQDANNASMGTISTATSSLSTSFEESVVDLFASLKPLSAQEKRNGVALNPPSMHNTRSLGSSVKRRKGKKKRRTRDTPASTSAHTSPAKFNTNLSTIGETKGHVSESDRTANTTGSEEMMKQLMQEMGEMAPSALDGSSPTSSKAKKDAGTSLSFLGNASPGKSSAASSSSAYLLERIPMDAPLTDENVINGKTSTKLTSKPSKTSDVSVDQSVPLFHAPGRALSRVDESNAAAISGEAQVPESPRNVGNVTKRTNVLATTLALMSPKKKSSGAGRQPRSSDTCAGSIQLFTPNNADQDNAATATEKSSSEKSPPGRTKAGVDQYTPSLAEEKIEENDEESLQPSEGSYSLSDLYKTPFTNGGLTNVTPSAAAMSSSSDSEKRRNPPARPWGGKTPEANVSLASSIKELSVVSVDKDSMLDVLITSLEKDGVPVEKNPADQQDSTQGPSLANQTKKTDAAMKDEPASESKSSTTGTKNEGSTITKPMWTLEFFGQACLLLNAALSQIYANNRPDSSAWSLQHVKLHGRGQVYLARKHQTSSLKAYSQETEASESAGFVEDIYEDPDAVLVDTSKSSSDSWQWDLSVVYSETWQTPVLYFHVEDVYRGEPCTRKAIVDFLSKTHDRNPVEDTWDFVSQEEHPVTGMPSFFLHPCRSNNLLGNLTEHSDDPALRLLQWMSILLPSIGISVTSKEFAQVQALRRTSTAVKPTAKNGNGCGTSKNQPLRVQPEPSKRLKSPARSTQEETGRKVGEDVSSRGISTQPLVLSVTKTPIARKEKVPIAESTGVESENASPRRRLRSRKPTQRLSTGVTSTIKLATEQASPTSDEPVLKSRRKTPTKIRHDNETGEMAAAGKKTPQRRRPSDYEKIPHPRKKTPSRSRVSPGKSEMEEGMTSQEKPNLAADSGNEPLRKRTPTKARNGIETDKVPNGRKTPTRPRPLIESKTAPVRENVTTQMKNAPELEGAPKTPRLRKTRVKKAESPPTTGAGGDISDSHGTPTGTPNTPTRIRKRAVKTSHEGGPASEGVSKVQPTRRPAALALEAPRTPRISQNGLDNEQSPKTPPSTRRQSDKAAADNPQSPPDDLRTTTPSRARKLLGSTDERVAAAFKTPPRERRSVRAVISQSPPRRRRVARTKSRSLSPVVQRNSPADKVMAEASALRKKRPSSAGRPRRPSKASGANDVDIDAAAGRKTPTRVRKASVPLKGSATPRTPSRLRRMVGPRAEDGDRTSTPTRSRRVAKTGRDTGGQKVESEGQAPTTRVLRPRRRGGEHGPISSANATEKESAAIVTPPRGSERPEILTRGRSRRARTPTKPGRDQKVFATRAASERRIGSTTPKDGTGTKRSKSLNKPLRPRPKSRSRSPHGVVAQLPLAVPL